ncbi:MAG: magnesium transporter, partial [Gemmatimonadetes bacterium]|nr:magnesium transporter [Gemmatimonadota bacterium]
MKRSAQEIKQLREQLDELTGTGQLRLVSDQASGLHPSDLADLIESLAEEYRVEILCMLPTALASQALVEMAEGEDRAELLAALPAEKIAEFLRALPDDDATDLIGELEPDDQRKTLATLPADEAGDIKRLLRYDEETAGGLMTTELVEVEASLTADEAIRQVRILGRDVEDFYTVFVIDQERRLLGTMRLDDLVVADPGASIKALVEEPSVTVSPDEDQEQVGKLLGRYNLAAIPVVTAEGVLLGRITFDDVIDVIESEQTEDILMLAGVTDEDELKHTWVQSVRTRLPWLMLNLATAAIAASVILVFKDLIEKELTLAFLAPIIAAMGGSSGTQSLAVTIRRITLQGSGSARGFVAKEILVGLVNGAVLGVGIALLAFLIDGNVMLGLVVLLA